MIGHEERKYITLMNKIDKVAGTTDCLVIDVVKMKGDYIEVDRRLQSIEDVQDEEVPKLQKISEEVQYLTDQVHFLQRTSKHCMMI